MILRKALIKKKKSQGAREQEQASELPGQAMCVI